MSGDELDYVKAAFDSNWIAPLGPNVDAFEEELSEYVGRRSALALCSGTAALHLALKHAGVEEGDYVLCSSLTFIGSVYPIKYVGAKPVFVDSEPGTWNMSPRALKTALSDLKQKGIFPKAAILVNLYGQTADMNNLIPLCDEYGITVIEDAAESLGATYDGRKSGSFGKFSILSFNGNKVITTSGGGMLLSDDETAIDKTRFWATQARDKAPWYEHSEIGYNYRMSNILAAIGRAQLRHLEARVKARRNIYQRYLTLVDKVEGIAIMPEHPLCYSSMWLTAITIDKKVTGKTPLDVMKTLAEENIESRPVWKPMHLQPVFHDCSYYRHQEDLSFSDLAFERGLCLPSGSSLSEEEQEMIINLIINVIKNP